MLSCYMEQEGKMRDLIDRQAAIMDAESWVAVDEYEKHLQKNVVKWLKEFPPAEQKIKTLPSVQPEIIRCKDCENWDTTWQNDWAKNYHYCPLIDGIRNGDWYCADAERRTDETN